MAQHLPQQLELLQKVKITEISSNNTSFMSENNTIIKQQTQNQIETQTSLQNQNITQKNSQILKKSESKLQQNISNNLTPPKSKQFNENYSKSDQKYNQKMHNQNDNKNNQNSLKSKQKSSSLIKRKHIQTASTNLPTVRNINKQSNLNENYPSYSLLNGQNQNLLKSAAQQIDITPIYDQDSNTLNFQVNQKEQQQKYNNLLNQEYYQKLSQQQIDQYKQFKQQQYILNNKDQRKSQSSQRYKKFTEKNQIQHIKNKNFDENIFQDYLQEIKMTQQRQNAIDNQIGNYIQTFTDPQNIINKKRALNFKPTKHMNFSLVRMVKKLTKDDTHHDNKDQNQEQNPKSNLQMIYTQKQNDDQQQNQKIIYKEKLRSITEIVAKKAGINKVKKIEDIIGNNKKQNKNVQNKKNEPKIVEITKSIYDKQEIVDLLKENMGLKAYLDPRPTIQQVDSVIDSVIRNLKELSQNTNLMSNYEKLIVQFGAQKPELKKIFFYSWNNILRMTPDYHQILRYLFPLNENTNKIQFEQEVWNKLQQFNVEIIRYMDDIFVKNLDQQCINIKDNKSLFLEKQKQAIDQQHQCGDILKNQHVNQYLNQILQNQSQKINTDHSTGSSAQYNLQLIEKKVGQCKQIQKQTLQRDKIITQKIKEIQQQL